MFNTDQSGFNIENLSGRTLEISGEKKVFSSANQSHSLTHSYTIQPMISMTGKLSEKLFIVLQEKDGKFGPLVRVKMFSHPEIYVVCTSSGKVNKSVLQEWFSEIYFPIAGRKSLLILDSFPTYKDRSNIDKEKPANVKYEISTIPPGLTPHCQPLDVTFFRPYKAMHRRFSDHINFHRPDISLHARDTILKLQACLNFLFRSPRFHSFIGYAWYKSGLHDNFDSSIYFEDPKHYCFADYLINVDCVAHNCHNPSFIRCS